MELYSTSISDPVAFIGRDFPALFHARANPQKDALLFGGIENHEIFRQFCELYNCVSITSGLPKNDAGQTIRLSLADLLPDLTNLTRLDIPLHPLTESMLLKKTEMTGRYRYQKVEDTRGGGLAVTESFFFEYQPGYRPQTFSELRTSLGALRDCSEITHNLDCFKVVLMEGGVYVHLRARMSNCFKSPFLMNS